MSKQEVATVKEAPQEEPLEEEKSREGKRGKNTTTWEREQEIVAALDGAGSRSVVVGELALEDLVGVMAWQVSPLLSQARELLDHYWNVHLEENNKRGLSDKSVMGCRMRIKGDSIYLEWYWNRWVKNRDNQSVPLSTALKRGKSYAYTPAVLLKYAKDWEVDLIMETEGAFAHIRRMNHFLSMARQNVREAIKSREKLDARQ